MKIDYKNLKVYHQIIKQIEKDIESFAPTLKNEVSEQFDNTFSIIEKAAIACIPSIPQKNNEPFNDLFFENGTDKFLAMIEVSLDDLLRGDYEN